MFENIIDQSAVFQLRDDILSGCNAPSMLFYGPGESGKGSAALELARALSCEADAAWTCTCSSCERHRYLQHDDVLILGNRHFAQEISAGSSAFLRNPAAITSKLLFYRSLRKLQMRFSPVLIEDDPNIKKIISVLQSFDEKLSEFSALKTESYEKPLLEKLCGSLITDALTLEKEGKLNISINHIRRACMWCRLAPNGKQKTLIIENAENMRDEARNSLLKLLEEPPSSVSIVLTAVRREAIIPTILSRLRPYRFFKRDKESEKKVINLIFKDTFIDSSESQRSLLSMYLESFVPQSTEKIYPLAAWFLLSLARIISISVKKNISAEIPVFIIALGEKCAQIAETLKLERSLKSADVIKIVLAQSKNFEEDSFSRFMKNCLDIVNDTARSMDNPSYIHYKNIFGKYIGEAVTAVEILNINKTIVLESLFFNLKKAVEEGHYG